MAIAAQVVTVREFERTDNDYEGVVAVDNAVYPEYEASVEEWRHDDTGYETTGYIRKRYVAEDPELGRIVGWMEYRHGVGFHDPQRFLVTGSVDPEQQGRGVGSALYERCMRDLVELGARRVLADTGEIFPQAIDFLQKRGFAEIDREWESRINPQEFDPAPFQKYLGRIEAEGIGITTLREVRESDPDYLLKLYELHTGVMADVPAPYPYTKPKIENFVAMNIEAPQMMPDAYFIARRVDTGEYVGESELRLSLVGPSPLNQGMTGVSRGYRGKGIAMALKVTGLTYAKEHGYDMLKTWNSTQNVEMLAINAKLGFARRPAWIEFAKDL